MAPAIKMDSREIIHFSDVIAYTGNRTIESSSRRSDNVFDIYKLEWWHIILIIISGIMESKLNRAIEQESIYHKESENSSVYHSLIKSNL